MKAVSYTMDELWKYYDKWKKQASLYLKIVVMFICFWRRERVWVGEGQGERETESEAGSRLWAVSTEPDAGLELTNREIMTWAKVGHSTDGATEGPLICSW